MIDWNVCNFAYDVRKYMFEQVAKKVEAQDTDIYFEASILAEAGRIIDQYNRENKELNNEQ